MSLSRVALAAVLLALTACPGRTTRAVPTDVEIDWPDAAPRTIPPDATPQP